MFKIQLLVTEKNECMKKFCKKWYQFHKLLFVDLYCDLEKYAYGYGFPRNRMQ